MRRLSLACALIVAAAACSDGPVDIAPAFPKDYVATYTEVRNCRSSGDHDLNRIRVLADAQALASYRDREQPFPEGAVVIKEEYDFGDTDCSGAIKQWTVMQRRMTGSSPATLDWSWQRVDATREVLEEDAPGCVGCHSACTPEQGGFDGTCTEP